MGPKISRRDAMKLFGGGTLLAAMGATGGCASASEPATAASTGGELILPAAAAGDEYTLPKLPYGYDALAPTYQERTLRIHHTTHHGGYVRGLNATLTKLAAARQAGDYAAIKALSRGLAFHGSGHVLHCLFWHSMTPTPSAMPAELARAMEKDFGSVAAAKAHFAAATKAVEGSGWGVLAYEPLGDRMLILQAEKHQNLTFWSAVPLLVADVWEHAYYLQYASARGQWVEAFMELANWTFAARRLAAARRAMRG